jgi:hypothetical protein
MKAKTKTIGFQRLTKAKRARIASLGGKALAKKMRYAKKA